MGGLFTLRAMQSGLSNVLNKLETNPVNGARKALSHEERNECERRGKRAKMTHRTMRAEDSRATVQSK